MALFGRTALDPETDAALTRLVGRRPRMLAAGRGPEGEAVGLIDRLVYRSGGEWHQQFWHDIERGNWDQPTRRLRWTAIDGETVEVELTETGMLPDLFNERVTASIACMRVVDLEPRGTAVITARRHLGDATAPLVWRISPGKGASPQAVNGDPSVAAELARLRAEYDLS
ncbi:MAG TPA: hypothetical protein VGK17_18045 [Propionicimonas sp.]|jgi:hypothetical protein